MYKNENFKPLQCQIRFLPPLNLIGVGMQCPKKSKSIKTRCILMLCFPVTRIPNQTEINNQDKNNEIFDNYLSINAHSASITRLSVLMEFIYPDSVGARLGPWRADLPVQGYCAQ